MAARWRCPTATVSLTRSINTSTTPSRDWHPAVTRHFKSQGGPWPAHCVQGSDGARFHPDLHLLSTAIVITKGESPDSAGYSAFEGRTPAGTPFLLFNSSHFLEIAANKARACDLLGAGRGDVVELSLTQQASQ